MAFPVQKFKHLQTHKFDVEVTTPLFISGADQTDAQLRIPSLKGMLRFWWRALYGIDNIEEMKRNEACIFGDTDHKSNIKISLHNIDSCKPMLKNIPKGKKFFVNSKGKTFPLWITEYLAYGLYEYQKGKGNIFIRPHFEPNKSQFTLEINVSHSNEVYILEALKTLYCFSGFGARNRNGFGGFYIPSFSGLSSEKQFKSINKRARKKFTSFSIDSKLFLFQEQNSWDAALSDAGLAYKNARNRLEEKHSFDKRQLIAKPIIVKNEIEINDRHAKPYFLHVHKMENGQFRGQILFLPYNYYKSKKQSAYDKACEDMNKTIRQSENFKKEISG